MVIGMFIPTNRRVPRTMLLVLNPGNPGQSMQLTEFREQASLFLIMTEQTH